MALAKYPTRKSAWKNLAQNHLQTAHQIPPTAPTRQIVTPAATLTVTATARVTAAVILDLALDQVVVKCNVWPSHC